MAETHSGLSAFFHTQRSRYSHLEQSLAVTQAVEVETKGLLYHINRCCLLDK